MEESIASHVTRCLGLFSNAANASDTSAPGPSASFNRSVRDEQTRFKVWSGNIGAHRTGMSSLDHRLRDSSNIRNQVVNLLLDLDGLLEDAIAILTGKEPSWDQISSDGGVFLDQDSEDNDSPDTELEQISVDVADVLSHGLDYHYLGDAETIASSLPGHLKDKIGTSQISQLPISEDNYSDARASQTSYATSAADIEQRRVPTMPKEASKGPFECPFCFTIIFVTDRSSWK
ncbi:hypothetical protein LCI18_007460 [Fusarium solani-melongenae]|uniref:Uncharacterized protein n=1 Tax=Fusarium solani subsp. cucurbitae TaxID=2747967 RepID=A0ACD3Z5N6_FUSSC|nr:hypothetical protein LCI18_007460 [Fusarium solani-melongenae]